MASRQDASSNIIGDNTSLFRDIAQQLIQTNKNLSSFCSYISSAGISSNSVHDKSTDSDSISTAASSLATKYNRSTNIEISNPTNISNSMWVNYLYFPYYLKSINQLKIINSFPTPVTEHTPKENLIRLKVDYRIYSLQKD